MVKIKNPFTSGWRLLIVFTLILSFFGIYLTYSQTAYILQILEENIPISIPVHPGGSSTAIVINPITGQFVLVSTASIVVSIIFILILFLLFFIYKKFK